MRSLHVATALVASTLLSGCFLFPPATPDPAQPGGGAQQATVVTTPAAPKPPPEPNLDELIGADVDTNNPEVFRQLKPKMSRKEVDAIFPGTAKETQSPFIEVPSTIPSVHHFRFYFSEGALFSGEIHFPASTSTPALWEKLVAAGNQKWGTSREANDEKVEWEDAKIKRSKDGIFIDAQVDLHRGKAGPLDISAFVGAGDRASAPAAYAPYPKTLSKEDARKLGSIEPTSVDSFVTVIPDEGSAFDEVEIYYGDYSTPRSVTIKLHRSLSNRRSFLALRDALVKRYGAGRGNPTGANDETLESVDWRAPRMSLDFKEKGIEIEFRYQ